MGILKRKTSKDIKPFEQTHELKRLSLFITIVNSGQGNAVIKLMEQFECAVSFIHKGEGTADASIYDILGLQDNGKDVVFSIIKDEVATDIKNEIEMFFKINKRNKGVAMRIPLASIVGINGYRFLTNQF